MKANNGYLVRTMPVSVPKRAFICPVEVNLAKLVAFEEGAAQLFGHLAGSVTVHGNVGAPVKVEWDAEA